MSSSGAAGHSYSAMNSGGWLQPSPPPAATALPYLFRKRSQVGSPSLPLCPRLSLCVCVSLSLCASGWRAAAVRGCCGLSVCAANQCGESPRRRDLSALVCRNGRLQCAPLRAAQVLAANANGDAEAAGEVRGGAQRDPQCRECACLAQRCLMKPSAGRNETSHIAGTGLLIVSAPTRRQPPHGEHTGREGIEGSTSRAVAAARE